ncbi:MAG: 3-dehydroquinate synthase II, partial [Desulfurococcaceae archaeon]
GAEEAKGLLSRLAYLCDGVIAEDELELPEDCNVKLASPCGDPDILIASDVKGLMEACTRGKRAAYLLEVKGESDVYSQVSDLLRVGDLEFVLVKCADWRVVPLENAIAMLKGRVKILAEARTVDEALLMANALEVGADGIVIEARDQSSLMALKAMLSGLGSVELKAAKVTALKPLGLGARVCVDTCELMTPGEGMLVGCQSGFLFLVEGEVLQNPYVQPRPFRVNAGPVGLYAYACGGRTKYLSELAAGAEVLIVNREGRCRPVNVCRAKIEWRPLILVEAECEGRRGHVILQNAETIRLVTSDGSKPVTELKPGDAVLVHVEEGARHLGWLVESERIIER